jgi:Coenzyme PQQ synthesis protein D (PqqD)
MELKMEGTRDLCYQKEAHISWKKPEGGRKLVILNLQDGDFYSLEDPTGIEIWEQLMAGKATAAILEDLARRHSGEDPGTLAQDLDGFIADLVHNKLICPRPPSGV